MHRMPIKKLLLNQAGAALLQVMIFAAVGAITIPILLDNMTNAKKMQRKRDNKEDYRFFIKSMHYKLTDPTLCTQLLGEGRPGGGLRVNVLSGTMGLTTNQIEQRLSLIKTNVPSLNTGWGDHPGPIIPGAGGWDPTAKDIELPDGTTQNIRGLSFLLDEIFIVPTRDQTLLRQVPDYLSNGKPKRDERGKIIYTDTYEPVGPLNSLKPWNRNFTVYTEPIRVYFRIRDYRMMMSDAGAIQPTYAETINGTRYKEFQISLLANVRKDGDNPNASGGQIISCFGADSIAAVCEYNGGSYDTRPVSPANPNTAANLRCKPGNQCFNHSQGLVNNPSRCPFPYEPSSVGNINGQEKYLCSWCHKERE